MANKILVVLEQRDNILKKISFEVAKAGAKLAIKIGCEFEAIIIGNDVSDLAKIGYYGINKVTLLKNSDLVNYSSSAYSKIVAEFANDSGANVLIFGNTSLGKELSPLVAAKLSAGIAMDCVELEYTDNNIMATRPIYAGKALLDVKVNSENKVFTLRPNVFNPGEPSLIEAEVLEKTIDAPDLSTKVTEVKKAEGKLGVAEASVIFSGGRGIKEAENFKLV